MTRPTPLSDVIADDLLLDQIGIGGAPGSDPVAALLTALAVHATTPLGVNRPQRRTRRHRFLSGLVVVALGASGAGVAAAVSLPDGWPQAGRAVDEPSSVPAGEHDAAADGAGGLLARRADGTFEVVRPDGLPPMTFDPASLPTVVLGPRTGRSGSSGVTGSVADRQTDAPRLKRNLTTWSDGLVRQVGSGPSIDDDSDSSAPAKPRTDDPAKAPAKDRDAVADEPDAGDAQQGGAAPSQPGELVGAPAEADAAPAAKQTAGIVQRPAQPTHTQTQPTQSPPTQTQHAPRPSHQAGPAPAPRQPGSEPKQQTDQGPSEADAAAAAAGAQRPV